MLRETRRRTGCSVEGPGRGLGQLGKSACVKCWCMVDELCTRGWVPCRSANSVGRARARGAAMAARAILTGFMEEEVLSWCGFYTGQHGDLYTWWGC